MMHLVGIYDTTTVRFECQTQRGFVPEHLTQFLFKLIRAEAIDFGVGHVTNQSSEKCPRDISVLLEFFFRSSINYPWQDRRDRMQGHSGVSISKDNSYLGLPTKKAIVKEENSRFTAFVFTPYSSVLLLFFFPSVHTRKIFLKKLFTAYLALLFLNLQKSSL